MNIISVHIDGDLVIDQDTHIMCVVKGHITISEGVSLHIHGEVLGDILIRNQGKLVIHGAVIGDVINEGGEFMVIGIFTGKLYEPN